MDTTLCVILFLWVSMSCCVNNTRHRIYLFARLPPEVLEFDAHSTTWICRTLCCTTNLQQIEETRVVLKPVEETKAPPAVSSRSHLVSFTKIYYIRGVCFSAFWLAFLLALISAEHSITLATTCLGYLAPPTDTPTRPSPSINQPFVTLHGSNKTYIPGHNRFAKVRPTHNMHNGGGVQCN